MQTKIYTTIDKTEWPRGPWDAEPDKMQYPDEATGLPCLIVRNRNGGALCGYVGVAKGHPRFKKEYGDVGGDIEVHGGLTFSEFCAPRGNEAENICHVPGHGEPDKVWWFGFDCAHAYDFLPAMAHHAGIREQRAVYRDIGYVKAEVASLAKQLHDKRDEKTL